MSRRLAWFLILLALSGFWTAVGYAVAHAAPSQEVSTVRSVDLDIEAIGAGEKL